MKKYLFYTYLIFLLVKTSQAQTPIDTINLAEVRLIESKLASYDIGQHIDIINTSVLSEGNSIKLSSLVSNSSSAYVKQYGALATPTLRGTSSSHTLVLWNGIPINSIANGLSDLSGIYCHNFSEIYIVKGGNGSVFGSGAIGGSVHLNTNTILIQEDELSFSSTLGSFGLSSQSIGFKFKNGKLTSKGSIDFLKHENNFEFINTAQFGNPFSVNEYGKIKSKSQNIDLVYKLNAVTRYNFSLWNSNLEREVSQNMTIPFSDAMQFDISKRFLFSFKHKMDYIGVEFKQAYINEEFRYTEMLKNIDSYYVAESYISDFDIKLMMGNYFINVGTVYTNNQINNNNYLSSHINEHSYTAFSALKYESKFFSINSVLRKEWQSSFMVPLIPTIALEAQILNELKFRLKFNRNFRSPSFNDRFWIGAGANGNLGLVPEDAFNKELGFDISIKNLEISATVFNLSISEMIFWQQLDNGIWMPENIKEVFSRGFESSFIFKFKNLSFDGNYAFTKSTSETSSNILDATVGEQLRYVPLHKGSVSVTVSEENLKFRLSKSYIGEVITSYGDPYNKTLDGFLLTDLSIIYKPILAPFTFSFKLKNLMDKSYVTYQNYPNPGREYIITLEYIIN